MASWFCAAASSAGFQHLPWTTMSPSLSMLVTSPSLPIISAMSAPQPPCPFWSSFASSSDRLSRTRARVPTSGTQSVASSACNSRKSMELLLSSSNFSKILSHLARALSKSTLYLSSELLPSGSTTLSTTRPSACVVFSTTFSPFMNRPISPLAASTSFTRTVPSVRPSPFQELTTSPRTQLAPFARLTCTSQGGMCRGFLFISVSSSSMSSLLNALRGL